MKNLSRHTSLEPQPFQRLEAQLYYYMVEENHCKKPIKNHSTMFLVIFDVYENQWKILRQKLMVFSLIFGRFGKSKKGAENFRPSENCERKKLSPGTSPGFPFFRFRGNGGCKIGLVENVFFTTIGMVLNKKYQNA